MTDEFIRMVGLHRTHRVTAAADGGPAKKNRNFIRFLGYVRPYTKYLILGITGGIYREYYEKQFALTTRSARC